MKFDDLRKENDERDIEMVQMLISSAARKNQSYAEIRSFLTGKFPENLIDKLIQQYKDENDVETLAAAILRSDRNKDKANWYVQVDSPDSRWGKLQKVLRSLRKPWEKEHIKDLDDQSTLVLKNLAPPEGEAAIYKGLVLGYVQSGKTANFSAVTAKAIDQGYKIIIVLGGLYNNLRSQTERRLRRELIEPHEPNGTICLTDATESGDFQTPKGITAGNLLKSKAPVFCVIKKNKSPMSKFLDWFEDIDEELLKRSPVLIIDDEADQASVNDGDPEQDRKTINELVTRMIGFFGSKTITNYVGYTATPFANIFIDANDKMDIYPEDFIVSLKPPKEYNGTERLFGRASIDGDGGKEGLNVFRFIQPDEVVALQDLDLLTVLPASLEYAVNSFLLACSERILRGQKNEHMTMLIHTSHIKENHSKMCGLIERYIFKAKLDFHNLDEGFLTKLESMWNDDFKKTTSAQLHDQPINEFDRVKQALEIFLKGLWDKPIMENSESKTRLDFTKDECVWAVIVGGNTLSRGLTVEGLTVSYFQRNSKGYDTLLQMGRWFGYRDNYLDLTRIFVTNEMHANFFFLATVEQEIREDIEQMAINNEKPIDVSIKVRDHDRLIITGKKVLKNNSVFSTRTYSGSKVQARYIYPGNDVINTENHKSVCSLASTLEADGKRSLDLYSGHSNCLLYKDVSSDKVLGFLEDFYIADEDKKSRIELFGPYVETLNKRNELNNWSVAIVSRKEKDILREIEINKDLIYSLDRKLAPRLSSLEDHTIHPLGQLMAQRDEIIDMRDILGDTFERKMDDNEEGLSYKKVRTLRPKERGILLIYPLYTHYNLSESEIAELAKIPSKSPIISKSRVIYSIAMVLPFSQVTELNFSYRENFTIKKST
jgi:hypothetical protein